MPYVHCNAPVEELMARLKDEHEGWIAVFNRRLRKVAIALIEKAESSGGCVQPS